MITQLRKIQDTWLAKAVLALTALSFMSLFGVSGYLSRAAENPAVIKVNGRKLSLAEFNMQLDEQIKMARRLFGDDLEISDEMRNALAAELVQKNLTDMVIKEVAAENNIYISDALIRNIILSQPQFRDDNGRFSPARFNNFLSSSNWSEQKYVEALRADLIKNFLISNPAGNMKVSKTLADLSAKAESQRKIFKYIEINPAEVKIDRKITEDETEQYYNDFSADFIEPETRDITVLELTFEDIAGQTAVSDAEIKEFYDNNIERFVVPEKRDVLQMLFADEETAQKAAKELADGADFYETAKKLADQSRNETDLGYVAKDMLIAEISDTVFDAKKGAVVGPIESELGWHLMKVNGIQAGSKTDDAVARKQIVEALSVEKAYDSAYGIVREIEDKIGAGSSLEDIAKADNLKISTVKGLTDTTVSPYMETAFLYNQGEVSQAIETDNGFAFVRVDNIVDAHPQDIKKAAPQIEKLWAESEKSAIAQEIINDVMADIENGDKIDEVAGRYKLKLHTTDALTRSQSFAGLQQNQMIELFNDELNTAKQFALNGKTIIAVAAKEAAPREMSDEDMDIINRRLSLDVNQQAAARLVDSYGKSYDVRVKYRQLGLAD
uniref:Parvulin-like PPIase n=1 Tax=uncultured Alphaproteobacteria bacterium TaxID=91750 RepID=A0A6G8F372_9PROT|nr:hypothetical protein PlAlph_6310 [uncultured Alphaproteobacteria bacterium]